MTQRQLYIKKDVTTDTTGIERLIKEYYEHMMLTDFTAGSFSGLSPLFEWELPPSGATGFPMKPAASDCMDTGE